MFNIEYVYIPLTGKAYVCSDRCVSFVVEELTENQMRLEFTHQAYNLERESVKFTSFVVVPKQKISVSTEK